MKIGLLYQYDKDKHEKELKEGKKVGIGVDPQSLIDEINLLESRHVYELEKVLAEVKYNLLVLLGAVPTQPAEEADKEGEKPKEVDDSGAAEDRNE